MFLKIIEREAWTSGMRIKLFPIRGGCLPSKQSRQWGTLGCAPLMILAQDLAAFPSHLFEECGVGGPLHFRICVWSLNAFRLWGSPPLFLLCFALRLKTWGFGCAVAWVFSIRTGHRITGLEGKQKRKDFSSVTTGMNVGERHKTWVVRRPRNDSRKSRVSESPSGLDHNIICSRRCAESL